MNPSHPYWVFDLSPFVFQVKNIDFSWVTTWWGILLLVGFFGGGFLFTFTQINKFKEQLNNSEKNSIQIKQKLSKFDFIQSSLSYLLLILAILYTLQKMQIDWGLRWYSTMYLLGFVAVYIACIRWIRKQQLMLTENMLMNLITISIVGMLIGARFAYVFIYNWDFYKQRPLEILATWEGGLSFHGGIVGVCLAIYFYCKRNKISFYHLTDKLVRVIPIGIGLGRIGNFFNGELWGRPITSSVPWAVIFPDGGSVPRHPSQIYQSIGEGWALFFTLYLISRKKQKEGTISCYFVIFYCIYRFIAEYFRAADLQINYFYLFNFSWLPLNAFPEAPWWTVLTMGQILCLSFLLVGCVLLYFCRNNILEYSPQWLKRNEDFFIHKLSENKKS
jgi:phosphatidylglycerol:prolipoprotein diacylglycerol transferase